MSESKPADVPEVLSLFWFNGEDADVIVIPHVVSIIRIDQKTDRVRTVHSASYWDLSLEHGARLRLQLAQYYEVMEGIARRQGQKP